MHVKRGEHRVTYSMKVNNTQLQYTHLQFISRLSQWHCNGFVFSIFFVDIIIWNLNYRKSINQTLTTKTKTSRSFRKVILTARNNLTKALWEA